MATVVCEIERPWSKLVSLLREKTEISPVTSGSGPEPKSWNVRFCAAFGSRADLLPTG